MKIDTIPLINLAMAGIPVIVVLFIHWKWKSNHKTAIYGIFRMASQLLLVGYALNFIFNSNQSIIILGTLSVMLLASSWISLRNIKDNKKQLFLKALYSISIGGGITLALITQLVLKLDPWFQPKLMIPIAGMIFANAMNSISLASERINAEIKQDKTYHEAKLIAYSASLIPITNSLFAVGLVSLPGMMTGQILSGVSPFIAVRYQIMVMCMLFGSAGISSALFLVFSKEIFSKKTL